MVLSVEGWLNGITATACLLFAFTCGLSIIFQARKINAKLLFFMGLNIFFTGFNWLIPSVDFFSILLKGQNIVSDKIIWAGILTYMWTPLIILISFYIGAELMISTNKCNFLIVITTLCVLFELLLFLDPYGSIRINYPEIPGNDLISIGILLFHPVAILILIFSTSAIIFCGFGFLYKCFNSSGILKAQLLFLSIGYLLYLLSPLILKFSIFLLRFGMVSSFPLFYLGLKEQSEEKNIKKPRIITEEEIILHKENQNCLVCNKKVFGFNTFICECGAIYCNKCAHALIKPENACWYCNSAIDKNKSVKLSESNRKNKVKIIEGIFRVRKNTDSEKKYRIRKEKKKCIVCKGNTSSFNVFICECGSFYCKKCAQALMKLENSCWACNLPINKKESINTLEENPIEYDDIKIQS